MQIINFSRKQAQPSHNVVPEQGKGYYYRPALSTNHNIALSVFTYFIS